MDTPFNGVLVYHLTPNILGVLLYHLTPIVLGVLLYHLTLNILGVLVYHLTPNILGACPVTSIRLDCAVPPGTSVTVSTDAP